MAKSHNQGVSREKKTCSFPPGLKNLPPTTRPSQLPNLNVSSPSTAVTLSTAAPVLRLPPTPLVTDNLLIAESLEACNPR